MPIKHLLFCWLFLLCIQLGVGCIGLPQQPNAEFPEIYNSESEPGEPLSPEAALACLQLPSGFSASLFSAEPDVQNPIAACLDAQGRVWVAENYTYAERSQRFDLSLNDRVVVLEDVDGDGIADKRTVFCDTLKMLTGITVGQGGVWLMCPPQLLFMPDADGDLVPDGPAEVKLDGFHVARENYHNFANGLSWGPDSWLYGRCGASCAGEMGLPGSADEERVPIRGGMWRFHPQRKVVEALTQGTTNPWGHDWNAVGELFFINTVNGHLWHAIPGAHFVRPHTLDANPYSYELIDMHADHWHFDTGKSWTASRDGAANDYGGGHAHIGMMIYQGDTWPEKYRGRLLTVNMHGRCINTERLEREGAGYVARHEENFLSSSDTWFRGMDIIPGPDGNALLIDWADTGECHEATGVHRTSGRIYKLVWGDTSSSRTKFIDADLAQDPLALAKLQASGSEWEARRAREQLRTLAVTDQDNGLGREELWSMLTLGDSTQTRLRALFALRALDAVSDEQLLLLLDDSDPVLRGWAIRLLSDFWSIDNANGVRPILAAETAQDEVVERLISMTAHESSAAVRLILASTLQRIPLEQRPKLAKALMAYPEDAQDHNLPLMLWYGLSPLGDQHLSELPPLASASTWSTTRRLIARRIADKIEKSAAETDRLIDLALDSGNREFQADVVQGMAQALAGRRKVKMPRGWEKLQVQLAVSNDPQLARAVRDLSVLFGDGLAIDELKRIAADGEAPLDARMSALESLVASRADGLRELCLKLLRQRFLNVVAANGLASETDSSIGEELIKAYRSFAPLDRPQVVSILASRSAWAASLLEAVGNGQIDRNEISPFQARQIASLKNADVEQLLAQNWGQVRESPAERQQQIHELKQTLNSEALAQADLAHGRALFTKSCSSCHKLYGQGGVLGPDLTGAQRSNLDYLLENIIDPSAVVTKEFRATIVLLDDARVLTGLVTAKSDSVVTLATQNDTFQIPTNEIEDMRQSDASTMPDGLLAPLSQDEIRDLFAYLQSKQQVDVE